MIEHMFGEMPDMIEAYWAWLKSNTTLQRAGDWAEITTPYLDRSNDHLQIYVKPEGAGLILTDLGNTIQELRMSGCDIATPRRQELLAVTLNGFGVEIEGDDLVVRGDRGSFPVNKHRLLQAMLEVDDLFFTSRSTVASLFFEDVDTWLRDSKIRYLRHYRLKGLSKLDHHFDFVVPASSDSPMRVIQAVNNPSKESVKRIAFSWIDTENYREPGAKAYAILNDDDRVVGDEIIEGLRNYDINPVLWSAKGQVARELAA